MQPLRSLLFVPGHRRSWVDKALAAGPDGLILDLEDSVPDDVKPAARRDVVASVEHLRRAAPGTAVYVRLNGLASGLAGDDLEIVAQPGVSGFVLPMVEDPDDVVRFDALVSHFERRNGLTAGAFDLVVSLETAQAYANCEALARAPRVATLFAAVGPDGDVARSIGFRFTPAGAETLYLRSRALLACRAAGLDHPLAGTWQDLSDDDGARAFAVQNRELGYRGQVVIHPRHVTLVNEISSPSPAEVEYYTGMIAAFEAAEAQGAAAVSYRNMHIDHAHVKTARDVLDLHARQTTGRFT